MAKHEKPCSGFDEKYSYSEANNKRKKGMND